MKNMNKNPIALFLVVVVLGWWAVETSNFEFFVVFVSAVVLAKQIEVLSR